MSSKGNVKFKFRIVVNEDAEYPYRVQRKGFIFWDDHSKHRHVEDAKQTILYLAKHEVMKPGKVVFEYSDEDFLVDKLKGENV